MKLSEPKLLGDPHLLGERQAMLETDPDVQPLREWLDRFHQLYPARRCPHFDPASGGVSARVLVVLKSPGKRPVGDAAQDAAFVSIDNPDETSANLWRALEEAGLDQREVLLWNIVPWYLAAEAKGPTADDLAAGSKALYELLALLPNVQTVVLAGGEAQKSWEKHLAYRVTRRTVSVPNPGPQALTRAGATAKLQAGLKSAASW